jgi:hypothetical protein
MRWSLLFIFAIAVVFTFAGCGTADVKNTTKTRVMRLQQTGLYVAFANCPGASRRIRTRAEARRFEAEPCVRRDMQRGRQRWSESQKRLERRRCPSGEVLLIVDPFTAECVRPSVATKRVEISHGLIVYPPPLSP